MRESDAVHEAMLHFYDRLSAGDVTSFDAIVAPDAALPPWTSSAYGMSVIADRTRLSQSGLVVGTEGENPLDMGDH